MLGRRPSQATAAVHAVMADQIQRIRDALRCSKYSYVAGSTHGFYHYPARFSAAIARAVIETFSDRGDWVLDPFMGGGDIDRRGPRARKANVGSRSQYPRVVRLTCKNDASV